MNLNPFRRKSETGSTRHAAALAAERVRGLPNEKLSHDAGSFLGLMEFFRDYYAGFPDQNRRQVIENLRALAQADEDMAGALRDLQALANPGLHVEFEGGARAVKAAEAEAEAWSPYKGGLTALADNQLRELYVTGASSLEWVPAPGRDAVVEAAVVQAETVEIRRDAQTQELIYRQQPRLGTPVVLHPVTYQYRPLGTDGASPYGIPVALSAVNALARKTRLLAGEERVIAMMSRVALVTLGAKKPTPRELGLESELDPDYAKRVAEYYAEVVELASSAAEAGIYAHPADTEVKATGINQTAAGLPELSDMNQKRIWSGLGSYPYLRGDTDTPYALAKVLFPQLLALAENMGNVVADSLAYGLNLHLRLRGIPALARVVMGEPANPFEQEAAEAELAKAKTDQIMLSLAGPAWAKHLADRWGIDWETDPEHAPEWLKPPGDTEDGEPHDE